VAGLPPPPRPPERAVGFDVKPAPPPKYDVLAEAMARCAAARAKMVAEKLRNGEGNPFKTGQGQGEAFSTPSSFRTLDSVKMLPSNRSRARNGDALGGRSPYRHASGARTNESPSIATTAITVRSAVQIREDRAFNEGLNQADVAAAAEARAKLLDLIPLDHGRGSKGIGTSVEKVWKSHLRGITPSSSKGDPVANNAMSRDGFRNPSTPGFFCKVPERLGQWRDDFPGNDGKPAWIPDTLIRAHERAEAAKEAKAHAEAIKKEQELRAHLEMERKRQEEAREIAREKAASDTLARDVAAREAEEREEKARKAAERKRAVKAPSCLGRQRSCATLPGQSSAMGAGGQ